MPIKADYLSHNSGEEALKNWIVEETKFASHYQGKCEATFALGNGYLGVRSATEESYVGQVRNCFVNGTFNKADDTEVTELPNIPDVIGMDIWVNGSRLNIENGKTTNYNRRLNLKNGELTRSFEWEGKDRNRLLFEFKRFVSFSNLHLIVSEVRIKSLGSGASVKIQSGIDGTVTNTGAQHFKEGEKRIFDQKFLQMSQVTNESDVDVVVSSFHQTDKSNCMLNERFDLDRRIVYMVFDGELAHDQELVITKYSNIYTSRDIGADAYDLRQIQELSLSDLQQESAQSYQELLKQSTQVWASYWDRMDVKIEGGISFDQLAIRFAMHHMMIMTPAHDNRLGIGAKGLSGEGYKGHSFWDTEIFIVPFFTYNYPEIARSLLEYRYQTIEGARKKAVENGYEGAMYPWESAWADDGEVTPVWAGADVITGEAMKIWSGFIEQHITSDVAFAVWQYYMITGDQEFMDLYGYEILLDTGIFWSSRLEWNEETKQYHINDVVGPDEYKEHVNNDAFTNYMAKWCMENAINYSQELKADRTAIYRKLDKKLNLEEKIPELKSKYDKVYLPEPNHDSVIPQDDEFLGLRKVDLSKYRSQPNVGTIFHDYNLEQINEMQVCKQASVVMLVYLLEHKFSSKIKRANYDFYEPITLHDSSLSLSTHAVLAADIDDLHLAYQMFQKAIRIDLGENMKTSDKGIHAASLGGIWQIVVNGFGGVRMVGGQLRINPKLPSEIKSLEFSIYWKQSLLKIKVSKQQFTVSNEGSKDVLFESSGHEYTVSDRISVNIS